MSIGLARSYASFCGVVSGTSFRSSEIRDISFLVMESTRDCSFTKTHRKTPVKNDCKIDNFDEQLKNIYVVGDKDVFVPKD